MAELPVGGGRVDDETGGKVVESREMRGGEGDDGLWPSESISHTLDQGLYHQLNLPLSFFECRMVRYCSRGKLERVDRLSLVPDARD